MPSEPKRCQSRITVGGTKEGTRCALPEHHESRHENGVLSWDHELIPNGTIEVTIGRGAGPGGV